MKFKIQDNLHSYRECAGKDCSRQGIHALRIYYINKCGWFCDSCRNSLIDDKLADEVTGDAIIKGICK